MIEERSAGVVIFRKSEKGIHFLLLNYPTGHWDFVKGKIETEESTKKTAVRETKEETGITDLEFIDDFEEKIEYNFQYDGNLIHKQVLFFLAETKTKEVNVSIEHTDYIWLDYEKAVKKITYQNARNVLSKAQNLLIKAKLL